MDNQLLTDGETSDSQLMQAARELKLPLNHISFKDQLKTFEPEAGAYIINMEDSVSGNGSHWIALFLAKEKNIPQAFYFDSYGVIPPTEIMTFAARFKAPILTYSREEIQKISSNYCGQYVLNYIYFMSKELGKYEHRYLKFLHQFKAVRYI